MYWHWEGTEEDIKDNLGMEQLPHKGRLKRLETLQLEKKAEEGYDNIVTKGLHIYEYRSYLPH